MGQTKMFLDNVVFTIINYFFKFSIINYHRFHWYKTRIASLNNSVEKADLYQAYDPMPQDSCLHLIYLKILHAFIDILLCVRGIINVNVPTCQI